MKKSVKTIGKLIAVSFFMALFFSGTAFAGTHEELPFLEDPMDMTPPTSEKVSVSVRVKWNDNNNEDGIRPVGVIITLLANNSPELVFPNLKYATPENDWTVVFYNLPEKDENGNKIQYGAEEQSAGSDVIGQGEYDPYRKYTFELDKTVNNSFVFTNTHITSPVTIKVKKEWDDNDNTSKKRPESVTFRLCADGKEIRSGKASSATNWECEFTDLPRRKNGNEITYSVTEDQVSDYSMQISGDAGSGFTVKNKYTPGSKSVTVRKVWDDEDDRMCLRPKSVTVRLYKKNVYTGESIILREENGWTGSFDMIDPSIYDYEYNLKEDKVSGYSDPVITGSFEAGYTITNKLADDPETIEIKGEKTWEGDEEGNRTSSIIVRLLADGVYIDSRTVTSSEGKWLYDFGTLPNMQRDMR